MYRGRAAEALDWFARADQFGPRDPGRWTWLGGKGQALILLGRDEEAIVALRAAIDSNAADISDYAVLAAAYALAGRNEEARAALGQYTRFRPGETVATFRNLSPVPLQLTDPSYQRQRERLKEGLRKAGMPDTCGAQLMIKSALLGSDVECRACGLWGRVCRNSQLFIAFKSQASIYNLYRRRSV
jgi:tetratricopeptide (TPR) repeat protein